jgi:hypothetical protein
VTTKADWTRLRLTAGMTKRLGRGGARQPRSDDTEALKKEITMQIVTALGHA